MRQGCWAYVSFSRGWFLELSLALINPLVIEPQWLFFRTIPCSQGSFLAGYRGPCWGVMETLVIESQIGHVQGKCLAHYTISPAPDPTALCLCDPHPFQYCKPRPSQPPVALAIIKLELYI